MSAMQRRPDAPTLNSIDEVDGARSTTEPAPPLSDADAPIKPQPTRSLNMTVPMADPPLILRASTAPPTLRESEPPEAPAAAHGDPAPLNLTLPGSENGLTPHSRKRTWDAMPAVKHTAEPTSLGRTLESHAAVQSDPASRDLSTIEPSPDSTLHSNEAVVIRSLPANAPIWMKRARELATSLEASITQAQSGEDPSQSVVTGIDRAYDAWVAGGFSNHEIATVSSSVRQTYRTIMRPTSDPASVVAQSAHALFKSLPQAVARWVSPTFLAQMVSDMRSHTSERDAVVRGTMRVLGWDSTSERSAERLIAAAQTDSEASTDAR